LPTSLSTEGTFCQGQFPTEYKKTVHPASCLKAALIIFPVPSHTSSYTPFHKIFLTLRHHHPPVNGSRQKQQRSHTTARKQYYWSLSVVINNKSFHCRVRKVAQRRINDRSEENTGKMGGIKPET
jgi:hypothetical protein